VKPSAFHLAGDVVIYSLTVTISFLGGLTGYGLIGWNFLVATSQLAIAYLKAKEGR
jgi:hypothetical protein